MVVVPSLTPTKGVTQVGAPWRSQEELATDGYQDISRGKDLGIEAWTPVTRQDVTGWELREGWGGDTLEGETTVSSSTEKEVLCISHTASPEYLRQLQVITLVVIGMIGLLIVSCLLLCMFYKNERLLAKLPWRKSRKTQNPYDISRVVNRAHSLRSIPSIRISPSTADGSPGAPLALQRVVGGTSAGGGRGSGRGRLGATQKKDKHKFFPTPKNMLLDVAPPLPPGVSPTNLADSSVHIPHCFAPTFVQATGDVLQGADAATASRFPVSPTDYHKPRMGFNDTDMRRHHPGMYARSQSLFGCSPGVQRVGFSDLQDDCSSVSGASWYSDDDVSLRRGSDVSAAWRDDDDEDGVAESRRGARGEKTRMSMRSKDEYSDKYGSSMSSGKGMEIGHFYK